MATIAFFATTEQSSEQIKQQPKSESSWMHIEKASSATFLASRYADQRCLPDVHLAQPTPRQPELNPIDNSELRASTSILPCQFHGLTVSPFLLNATITGATSQLFRLRPIEARIEENPQHRRAEKAYNLTTVAKDTRRLGKCSALTLETKAQSAHTYKLPILEGQHHKAVNNSGPQSAQSLNDPRSDSCHRVLLSKPSSILQEVQNLNPKWDDELPANINKDWLKLMAQWLDRGEAITIEFPRHIQAIDSVEFHCFCDASKYGMGIAVYQKAKTTIMKDECNLIYAKSLVKPIKVAAHDGTIPKLELQALTLGVKAVKFVQAQIKFADQQVIMWTDSQCSVERLRDNKRQDRFVANRLQKIREANFQVRHVRTDSNPADMASRGTDPQCLRSSLLWRFGPIWLSKTDKWPESNVIYLPGDEFNEIKEPPIVEMTTNVQVEEQVSNHHSNSSGSRNATGRKPPHHTPCASSANFAHSKMAQSTTNTTAIEH
ncbi:hypothetical protein niasHT_035588 [Heterodera trifolii]|uniref:Polyprotein n=1 Tax=Heterodera trifolii TaxID=157864 RepID=A0ABD2IKZ1_9BILA